MSNLRKYIAQIDPTLLENIWDDDDDGAGGRLHAGAKVRFKPEYAGTNPNEIYTVSQFEPGEKFWVGDEDGRGWYARDFQVIVVDEPDDEYDDDDDGSDSYEYDPGPETSPLMRAGERLANGHDDELGETLKLAGVKKKVNELDTKRTKLDKVTWIIYGPREARFARAYKRGKIGDYMPGGPSEKQEANSEAFWSAYSVETVRSGFAGSGERIYTSNKTGEKFSVSVNGNNRTFHGADHTIKKIND